MIFFISDVHMYTEEEVWRGLNGTTQLGNPPPLSPLPPFYLNCLLVESTKLKFQTLLSFSSYRIYCTYCIYPISLNVYLYTYWVLNFPPFHFFVVKRLRIAPGYQQVSQNRVCPQKRGQGKDYVENEKGQQSWTINFYLMH